VQGAGFRVEGGTPLHNYLAHIITGVKDREFTEGRGVDAESVLVVTRVFFSSVHGGSGRAAGSHRWYKSRSICKNPRTRDITLHPLHSSSSSLLLSA